jgi:hypothetical protein
VLERAIIGLNNLPVTPPKEIEGKFDNENMVKV